MHLFKLGAIPIRMAASMNIGFSLNPMASLTEQTAERTGITLNDKYNNGIAWRVVCGV